MENNNSEHKILLLDTIADKGLVLLSEFANVEDGRSFSKDQLISEIHKYDGLVIKSNNFISRDILEKAHRLKVIGRAGSGTDNIDLETASEKNIEVICSPEGNASSVAEYVLGMSILMSHQIHASHQGSKSNDFRRHLWQGKNIENLTLGVIGYGHIGKRVVEKMAPLCREILVYDPNYIHHDSLDDSRNIQFTKNPESVFSQCDILTLHCPLKDNTKHMINRSTFSIMKQGSIIINSSRGKLIDEEALLVALENGTISSAVLDSIYPDPPYNKSPHETTYSHFLVHHPKVYYTPHIAAGTHDALEEVACNLARKIKSYLLKN